MKVLNFGSLNIDMVYAVDHFVRAGETLSSDRLVRFCGGKGLNQSVALARAGATVLHAGCIGRDGGMLLDLLAASGTDTRFVRQLDEASGHAIIQVDKKGQNCILLYGGANLQITEAFADQVLAACDRGDVLLLQNEINLLPYIVEKGIRAGNGNRAQSQPHQRSAREAAAGKDPVFHSERDRGPGADRRGGAGGYPAGIPPPLSRGRGGAYAGKERRGVRRWTHPLPAWHL